MSRVFQGSDEEWQALEAPFLELDPKLNVYALANGLDLLKNLSGHPERVLEWYHDGMERRISLVAQDASPPRASVGLAAFRKQDGTPMVVRRSLGDPVDFETLREDFAEFLGKAIEATNELTRDQLEPRQTDVD